MAKWDAARWRAVSAEIDRLLDLPPDARDGALATLRTRDAALAADVAQLLAAQPAVEAGRFLEERIASSLPTATGTSETGPGLTPAPLVLQPGTTFGGYRLGRVLGRGGMGVVYEAEELSSARRVALKVLQRRHGDEYDRERFEREGRLAASIDHEHCVFVFGAEEIDGVPAIAMERMQGTLADRLQSEGPMPPAASVDATLQLVAGLQAAQAAGILHRDVKPSNCFVDAAGVVKIGDFGISRSTRPTDETVRSTRTRLAATPAYASPEQLSGRALDARADIYSLGATLYELLTGERPFVRDDLMSLLMAVANEPPRPPHLLRPEVPKGLSQVVLRCLAKRPEHRFQDYGALTAALEPYASWSPAPATLGRRFVAGAADFALLTFVLAPVATSLVATRPTGFDRGIWALQLTIAAMVALLYFALCEWRWSATPGKAMLGLTLVDTQSRPPDLRGAFLRALLFLGPTLAADIAAVASAPVAVDGSPGSMPRWVVIQWTIYWSTLVVLFSTARRRNGFAGLHDLGSGTRVVTAAGRASRVAGRMPASATPRTGTNVGDAGGRRGDFVLLPGSLADLDGWRPGRDSRLGRPVWIRELAPGTPPVAPARAAIARPTRLRWLAGRRTEREAWDVYEAVAGVPLSRALAGGPEWGTARTWIADLAEELAAQGPDDRPPLRLDRVWVLDSGHAKLLDDSTTDLPSTADDRDTFLADVMTRLRRVAPTPWPVSATALLGRPDAVAAVTDRMAVLERARPAMTPAWRTVSIVLAAFFAIVMTVITITGSALVNVMTIDYTRDERAALEAIRLLRKDVIAERRGFGWGRLSDPDREAIELFLAHQHLSTLRRTHPSGPPVAFGRIEVDHDMGLDEDGMAIVDRVLRRAAVDGSDGAAALGNLRVREIVRSSVAPSHSPLLMFALGALVLFSVNAVVAVCLAVICRGVALRLLGYEILAADGTRASRLRVTCRALVAWSPVLVLLMALNTAHPFDDPGVQVLIPLGVAIFLAGAVYAAVNPSRGLQDRLAGTWIVPR